MCEIIKHLLTDTTLIAGFINGFATIGAVIYTNKKTKKQLIEQENKYQREKEEQLKQQKYVTLKPTLLLNTFNQLLETIILKNNYNRILLLSGNDGFEFFDDINKRANQTCRILLLENPTENDISNITLITKSTLTNMNTYKNEYYETKNNISLIRGRESFVIRLMNESQFNKIIEFNNSKIPSLLDFICEVEYSTLANQRIKYVYKIKINNDRNIDYIDDGIKNIVDIDTFQSIEPTKSKNLQDYLNIDRNMYAYQKIAYAMSSVLPLTQSNNNNSNNNSK